MPDVYDAVTRSATMRAVRSKDTKPEMRVRRTLHRMGFRYRLHRRDLPGSPDIVLPKYKTALFIHGCFWHSHPGCSRAVRPTSNAQYWNHKLDRNVSRDNESATVLAQSGWLVATIWECGDDS